MAARSAFKDLILDADLPPRLRPELVARGFAAVRLSELRLHRMQDEPMIQLLVEQRDVGTFVMVTGDDKMPKTHRDLVLRTGLAIATIDGRWEGRGYPSQECWHRDVVHRWAHRMRRHDDKEIRRYRPDAHALWRPRAR